MTGLSVLYAEEAPDEEDWAAIRDQARPGRLREVYWARRAESSLRPKLFLNATLTWRPDRALLDRRSDDPGDGFIYLVDMDPQGDGRFEWLEVTEVFTTVPPQQIEGAMQGAIASVVGGKRLGFRPASTE